MLYTRNGVIVVVSDKIDMIYHLLVLQLNTTNINDRDEL